MTLLQAIAAASASGEMRAWASDMLPTAVTVAGWVWAGKRIVKTVDRFGARQDDHEALDNTRFENVRRSIETHGNAVQGKFDEVMAKWEDQRVDYATLQAEIRARLPEARSKPR